MNLLVEISSYCFAEILQIYFGHYLEEMHFCHVQLSLSKFDDWVHFRWCIRRYITSKSNIKGPRNCMVEYNRLVRIIRINKGFKNVLTSNTNPKWGWLIYQLFSLSLNLSQQTFFSKEVITTDFCLDIFDWRTALQHVFYLFHIRL